MATPVVSGAIVKLSNEKIRKYHLARALQPPSPPLHQPSPYAFTPSVLFLLPFAATLFPPSLSSSIQPVFSTMAGTTVEPSGGYQRLPEMVPLVDWRKVARGSDGGRHTGGAGRGGGGVREGAKNGQSFVRSAVARALPSSENFQINEDIPFEITLRHQRRSPPPRRPRRLSTYPLRRGVVTIFHKPVRRRDVTPRDAFSAVVSYSVDPRLYAERIVRATIFTINT